MIIGIYYKKSKVKTGKPIVVSNGISEIHTDTVILDNVSGQVLYGGAKNFPIAARHGTTTPLLIKIKDDNNVSENEILNFTPTLLEEYLKDLNLDEKKRIKERIRYRKNNLDKPSSKSRLKKSISNLT